MQVKVRILSKIVAKKMISCLLLLRSPVTTLKKKSQVYQVRIRKNQFNSLSFWRLREHLNCVDLLARRNPWKDLLYEGRDVMSFKYARTFAFAAIFDTS